METVRKAVESVRAMWAGLSAAQRAAVAVLAVALAAAVAWGASAAGSHGERMLVDSKTPYDQQNQVRERLAELGIPHKVRDGGIWVAADRIDEARLAVAPVMGDEMPIQPDWFPSPGQDAARQQQALQYKLARMIAKIEGVRGASVQLTVPRPSGMRTANEPGSAAVIVELRPNVGMTRTMVNQIAGIVSGAGVRPEHVRVVGPTGVYRPGDDGALGMGEHHEKAMQMGASISRMIENLVANDARVMTTVRLSPKRVEEERIEANPSVTKSIKGKDEENFVPTTTIRSMTPAGTEVLGLSVAVVIPVNAATTTVPPQDPARSEFLASITQIVRNATGIADERNITVATLAVPVPAAVVTQTWRDWMPELAEYGAKALLVLLVLLIGYGLWRITRASVERASVEVQESAGPAAAMAAAGLTPAETESARLRAGASETALRDPRQAAEAVRRLLER